MITPHTQRENHVSQDSRQLPACPLPSPSPEYQLSALQGGPISALWSISHHSSIGSSLEQPYCVLCPFNPSSCSLCPHFSKLNVASAFPNSWKPLLECLLSFWCTHRFILRRNAVFWVLTHPIHGLFISLYFLTVFTNFYALFGGINLSVTRFSSCDKWYVFKVICSIFWLVYRDIIDFCLLIYIWHTWEFAHYLFSKYSLSTATCQAPLKVLEGHQWTKWEEIHGAHILVEGLSKRH